jgi:hypothetical protein
MHQQPIFYKKLMETVLANVIKPNYNVTTSDIDAFIEDFNLRSAAGFQTFWIPIEIERYTANGTHEVEVEIKIGATVTNSVTGSRWEQPEPFQIDDITLLAVRFDNANSNEPPVNIIEIMAIDNWVESKTGNSVLWDKINDHLV